MNLKLFVPLVVVWLAALSTGLADQPLRIATFQVDATPPLGSPVAYAPARKILDPLSARGIVLLPGEQPAIVLCAVDWLGIANGSMDAWREQLAAAAGTSVERVTVHALHQHDGVRCDFTAEAFLAEQGLGGLKHDVLFSRKTIANVAEAIRQSIREPRVVTHLGVGQAKVEKVASNRRLLGPDGKVKIMRFSKSRDPQAIAAPEGVIDPYLRMLVFFHEEQPLVALSYYATHPQSYYGKGDVTSEFVGLARGMREQELSVMHVHFNGASGNVAAGKYNDGSTRMRPILAERMATGMKLAWQSVERVPLTAQDVRWRTTEVILPLGSHLVAEPLLAVLRDDKADATARLTAAKHLAWLRRTEAGTPLPLSCLQLGKVYVLHMPGELFVEYQLAAQAMRPDDTVCMAAYGEYGPGYIGTEISYTQGGYETSPRASRVSGASERVLLDALEKLLK